MLIPSIIMPLCTATLAPVQCQQEVNQTIAPFAVGCVGREEDCFDEGIQQLCEVTDDPSECEFWMYECVNISVWEWPNHPVDGILENCIEGYSGFIPAYGKANVQL